MSFTGLIALVFGLGTLSEAWDKSHSETEKYEKEEHKKLVRIADACNELVRAHNPNDIVTNEVTALKRQFDQIDENAFISVDSRKDYVSVRNWFKAHGL